MAHSKYRVFEEERNTLYLSMDGDNRLTGDPKEIDRIMERKKNTEIRIYKMLTGAADSDEFSESEEDVVDDRPKVKLIVEEVLPDGAEDDKPPDSVGDFVDPLSQLDNEQMLRLKTALASEQAKQILGDNVTAMLDVLSVDDTAFLRNSIMQDHCYTPLSPSADPKGASFVQANNRPEVIKRPVGRPSKNEKPKATTVARYSNASPLMPDSDDQAAEDDDVDYAATPEDTDSDIGDGSDSDYRDRHSVGFGVRPRRRGGARTRGFGGRGKHRRSTGRSPRREREREKEKEEVKEVKPREVTTVTTNVLASFSAGKRGRPRRGGSTASQRISAVVLPVPSSTAQEPELSVDHIAAKMYSDDAIRLGRSGKSKEERRKDIARVLQNLPYSQKVARTIVTGPKTNIIDVSNKVVIPTAAKPAVEVLPKKAVESPSKNVMGGKYPRRENRKLPSHLADSFGPDIFSMPDLLRRKPLPSSSEDGTKSKPVVRVVQKAVVKCINKTKVESSVKDKRSDDLKESVNDLQSMLEEGLDEPTTVDSAVAANVSNDALLTKEIIKKVANLKTDRKEESQSLDTSQMDASLLHELPVENMDELLQSVIDQENTVKDGSLNLPTSDSGENVLGGEASMPLEERRRSIPKRRRSDEISNLEDSDIDDVLSEGSWNSDDDPDKLWCICRQPHNNRFMICCDVCEDWFHGKCVGIPKSIGKQMEQDNLEWSCPDCRDKKSGVDKSKTDASGKLKPELKQTKLFSIPTKRHSSDSYLLRKCIMCKGAARENSIYCSDQCISKHSQKALAQVNEAAKNSGKSTDEPVAPQRIIVLDPANKQVLTGPSAPTVANLATWLLKNPRYRVYNPKDARLQSTSDLKKVKNIVRLKPFLGDGKGKQLTLTVSPNSKIVKVNTGNLPVVKVFSPGVGQKNQVVSLGRADSDVSMKIKSEQLKTERKIIEIAKTVPKRRREKDPPATTSSKTEGTRERANERAVRDSVRRTLGDTLKTRVEDCTDMQVNYAEIEDLAAQIEERLYKHFENKVDAKYKSKFRSLVFNIKDQKNKTLFRKIVEKAIGPKELVRLSPDEMASQELAQWREREQQHQLDIIKKSELDLMTQGQTFILKSRKGEEIIEKVQNVAAEIDPNTPAQELVSALNSVTSTTPDNSSTDKQKKSETSLMKMKKREKERRSERDRRHKRSRSRSRSKRGKTSRKRSRSRSRDRHRRSSDKKDSKSRSSRHSRDSEKIKEKEVEINQEKEALGPIKEDIIEITTSEDVEQNIKDAVAAETDYEPTSTVTIKTPDTQIEETEEVVKNPVWTGQIIMSDVANFQGHALLVAGDGETISVDAGEKLTVIGRIGYNTVWDYLAKVKQSVSKEILILQILPNDNDQDRSAFSNLFSYLQIRSRIAVVKRACDRVKDFYLYPHQRGLAIPHNVGWNHIPLKFEKSQVLLGIVVRTKRGAEKAAANAKYATKSTLPKVPLPPTSPETSTLKIGQLPLPDLSSGSKLKLDAKMKKKVRVRVQSPKITDDGDSPYSPASSDGDLPLLKIAKKSEPKILAESDEIQKKIDEMNRAIEEQTQQIQSLASTVPLLPIIAPVLAASLPSVAATPNVATLQALNAILTTPMEIDPTPESVEPIPMDLDEPIPVASNSISEGEPYSPSGSLSPALEEPAAAAPLVLPQEVAKISIPSNLQEILASIKQTTQDSCENVPSPPISPKSSPKSDDSPEPPPPGVDLLELEPDLPKLVTIADDSDEAPPIKITPKKAIKIDIKINQRTKALLAEAANDHFLSHTDRDERLFPTSSTSDEITEIPLDGKSKPVSVEQRTTSNKDERRGRQHGRKSDAHRSDRHWDPERKELEAEWEGSIRKFENESRRRHREIREKEIERLRRRSDSE